MAILTDLITADFATAFLAAAGRTLTTPQISALPSKITAASNDIRRWCGDRDFTRATYTETYRPSLDGRIGLRQLPVNKVLRASRSPVDALTITADPGVAQVADVGFAETGDWATGLVVTGLAFSWITQGTASTDSITYASLAPPTIASLAAAVNTLGSPWSATVPGSYGTWPTSELIGGESALGALQGASLKVYSEDCPIARLERGPGLLWVGRGQGNDGFGPSWGPDWGLWSDAPLSLGPVRLTYDAGFDAIPAQVQEAAALHVGKLFDDSARDLAIVSETVGRGSYTVDPNRLPDLSPEVKSKLIPYRITRT